MTSPSDPSKILKNPQNHPLPHHPMIPDDTDLGVYSQEIRYVTDDDQFIRELQEKLSEKSKPRVYHTYTFYLDRPHGGWMGHKGETKYRFRNYNGLKTWFFEQKRHSGNKTYKRRMRKTWDDLDKLKPLVPVFASRYVRTEYEFAGIRVTIDRHLEAIDKHEKVQAVFDGKYIIELKRSPNMPSWLLDMLRKYRAPKFSKSEWIRKKLGMKMPKSK